MSEYHSVVCSSPEHILYIIIFGLPLILIYMVGVPALCYYTFNKPANKKHIQAITEWYKQVIDPNETRVQLLNRSHVKFFKIYSLFFIGYKSETAYWETVVMLRKALISFLGAMAPKHERIQLTLCALVMMISLLIHAHYKPYEYWLLNYFEMLSMFCTLLGFLLGTFNDLTEVDSYTKTWVDVLSWSLIIGFFIATAATFKKVYSQHQAAKAAIKQHKHAPRVIHIKSPTHKQTESDEGRNRPGPLRIKLEQVEMTEIGTHRNQDVLD